MIKLNLDVRHGRLIEVLGNAVHFHDIAFVPSLIELSDDSFERSHPLADEIAHTRTEVVTLVSADCDAPWVAGRLKYLFHLACLPEEERPEKSFSFATFIAVLELDGKAFAIPFECSDYYGRSKLTFSSSDAPTQKIQDQIAAAFWQLLLSEPMTISDYEERMYHDGAGVWARFGVKQGVPFVEEDEVDSDE